jgi:endoglycosylceramidase
MRLVGLVCLVAACGDNTPGRCLDRVCDGALRDDDGRAMVLRGVNLAGAHKTAPYTSDYTQAEYTRLRAEWGMTAIRFLVTWSAIEPAQGRYDDAYLDWVRARIQLAHAAGLAVVIDMHQDVYGEGFGFDGAPAWTCDAANYASFTPKEPWGLNYGAPEVMACFDHLWSDAATRGALTAAWKHVAERLADEPAVIGFDILNEPSWGSHAVGSFERDVLQPFYEETIAEVRTIAPHWVAFVEPSNSRNLGFATSLQPFAATNVVYAPHLYDVAAEQTGGFDPAKATALIEDAADLAGEAEALGTPLWIGEYGGQGADPEIGAYMHADYQATAAVAAGAMAWAYDKGGGYSLLTADGAEVPALVDAIVRPAPSRIAGNPTGWSFDPDSRVFELSWTADPRITAPTIVIAPARVYPEGIVVDCDCSVERVGDEVHLTRATGVVTARIAPAS